MDFKRIMIGLDFTEMDEPVLRYASYIAEFLEVKNIFFIHITPNEDVDEDIMKEHNLQKSHSVEVITDKMKKQASDFFPYEGAEIDYSVHFGSVTEEFLNWINVKGIDLVFVGRKTTMGGSGLIPTRIARRSNASIWFVPQKVVGSLKNIVVPVDYSDYSKNALNSALEIKGKNNESNIYCENVYFVPQGYSKTGKSYEEFAEIMKNNSEKNFNRFSQNISGEYDVHFSLDDDQSPADKIYEYADNIDANLIILGGKGRTFASSVLIGSVAEKLIGYDTNIPLLILKNKNEKWGIWEALKNL